MQTECGSLVLRIKTGESLEIEHGGETLLVKVLSCRGTNVGVLFSAPRSFQIVRTGAKRADRKERA